jgi:hypothetical protein
MNSPDYQMSYQSGYVLVERLPGHKVILSDMPAFLREISAFCDAAGCRKVLLRGPRTTVDLSTLDLYDLGEQIAGSRLQIAVVETHDASDEDEAFLETVVFNRGGPLQFFDAEEDARNWLERSY